jgi:ubiquinone/menaquinone biosynthesis C-methylase UbiE
VLELGVGTGLNLPHYERADTVVAVDHDPAMLQRANKRAREAIVDVHLIAADAHDLPFPADTFATVVVGLSLCTIPDPDQALVEALRVATPDGELHFLEHVRATHSQRVAHFEDRIAGLWGKVAGGCRPNQDTAQIIVDAGWEISTLWQSDRGGLIQGTAVPKAGS